MNDDQPLFDKDGQGPSIASMGDFFADDPPEVQLEVVDRSDLEEWANCPHAAWLKMSGVVKPNSQVLLAGQIIHDAFSQATLQYIADYVELVNMGHQGMIVDFLINFVMDYLRNSRPDLQPEAIDGVIASVRSWAWDLSNIHALNILGCDGGKGDLSSQFAKDYPEYNVRATSEIDLLWGDSPEVIEVIDYKTGYSPHSYRSVAEAFQFRMHAVLIFDRFETVQSIFYRVWGTRFNKATHRAEFKRRDYVNYESQLRSAVKSYRENKEKHPCWPVAEKCSECDCILHCPVMDGPDKDIETDPAGYIAQIGLRELKVKAMKDVAKAKVNRDGHDIVGHDGQFYGINKPKERDTPTLYTIKTKEKKNVDSN